MRWANQTSGGPERKFHHSGMALALSRLTESSHHDSEMINAFNLHWIARMFAQLRIAHAITFM